MASEEGITPEIERVSEGALNVSARAKRKEYYKQASLAEPNQNATVGKSGKRLSHVISYNPMSLVNMYDAWCDFVIINRPTRCSCMHGTRYDVVMKKRYCSYDIYMYIVRAFRLCESGCRFGGGGEIHPPRLSSRHPSRERERVRWDRKR